MGLVGLDLLALGAGYTPSAPVTAYYPALAPLDRIVAGHALSLFAIELAKSRAVAEAERRLQGDLFDACRKGDLDEARRINDRLDPLVRAFYAPPFVDMHNRMKEALVVLGRLPAAHVRPPLTPIPERERDVIRAALAKTKLGVRP